MHRMNQLIQKLQATNRQNKIDKKRLDDERAQLIEER